jgi:hypothetical protein
MLLQLLVSALALVALPQAPSAAPALAGSSGGQPQFLSGPHGPAHGHFSLPSPAAPGALHGLLIGPFGTPLFAVHAHVTAGNAPAGFDGRVDGMLVRLVGPNPGPVAEVHGAWRLGAQPNAGVFRVHVIVPGDPQNGIPPNLIGRIQGHFLDANGPPPPAGGFHGHWALHP